MMDGVFGGKKKMLPVSRTQEDAFVDVEMKGSFISLQFDGTPVHDNQLTILLKSWSAHTSSSIGDIAKDYGTRSFAQANL